MTSTTTCQPGSDCYTEALSPLCSILATLYSLTLSYMFFSVPVRTSDAVDCMVVSPLRGVVIATLSSGTYEYHGISRRAILNLLANPNMSLGS